MSKPHVMLSLVGVILSLSGCNMKCGEERAPAKNVVLIVLDAMRNDHISLCGYPHRNTPNLERLAKLQDASHTCNAVAPGAWTLPSHASFFTGVDPAAHGAHTIVSGVAKLSGWGAHHRNLPGDIPTLAERMDARGYQTIAYSANPVVNAKLGLLRGFQEQHVAKDWYDLFGDDFMPGLEEIMSGVNKQRPFFLFLNIADAHQPWAPVPEGVAWSKPVPRRLSFRKHDPESFWRRFVEGRISDQEAEGRIKEISDHYAHANHIADKNLGRAYDFLMSSGYCEGGCRFVVVSDHGEFMGEHRLLDHGHYVWEGMVRVPLLHFGGGERIDLPEVVSAMQVFHLVSERRLSEEPIQIRSMAWPHVRRCNHTGGKAFCSTSAAIWDGHEKQLFMDDKYYRIDLKKNPGEILAGSEDTAPSEAIRELARRVVADREDENAEVNPETLEQLKALGYMD